MNKSLILIFFLSTLSSFSQMIGIDTLRIPSGKRFEENRINILKFPVIKTGNNDVDAMINTDIKNRVTDNEFQNLSADSALRLWTEETIVYMSFDVTYLKNEIISLNISMEGCGAYCSNWTEYFNYSTTTGKSVSIGDIVDTSGNFKIRVITDKNKQYTEQKENLKKLFLDKNSGLDEESYNYVLEDYSRCQSSDDISTFALYTRYLEIINTCSLPNAVKSLNPIIELKYKYADIKNYLKIRN